MAVKIIDNQFNQYEIAAVHQECLSIPCTWAAVVKKEWTFWSGHIYNARTGIDNMAQYPGICNVWKTIQQILPDSYEFKFVYINAQSLGNESPLHLDDGDLTVIYYVNPDWKIEWDGGTAFYNSQRDDCIGLVSYKAGRMVVYDSKTPHKPQAISIHAQDVRFVLVFKLIRKYE